jgi:hypothetical protein
MPHTIALSNMTAQVVPTTLSAIETELGSINKLIEKDQKRIEKKQWRISELLWAAKDMFASDKDFKSWVASKTGYTLPIAIRYIDTYDRFKDNQTVARDQASENPIPFTKLEELSSKKVKARTIDNVVKKLQSKKPPTREEVRKIVREAQPDYVKPEDRPVLAVRHLPPMRGTMEERLKTARKAVGKFDISAWVILDLAPESNVETAKLVAKFWKQKYHPDREGGDLEAFQIIKRAEEYICKTRGV